MVREVTALLTDQLVMKAAVGDVLTAVVWAEIDPVACGTWVLLVRLLLDSSALVDLTRVTVVGMSVHWVHANLVEWMVWGNPLGRILLSSCAFLL